MPDNFSLLLVYVLPMLAVWVVYAWVRRRRHRRASRQLQASREAGLTEPASLHPLIDPALCLGCGSCVEACPEGKILGLLDGKSTLVDPTSCIGHGACRDACPHDAITLVLGTETRGVEIPQLNSDFQTNVPGIYVAGELGGMGLIRNAIIQGRRAMDEIADSLDGKPTEDTDVIVVGAGPAGIAASLRARERGLRCLTIEQDTLGGTVAHYPRGKIVMTVPVELPLYGTVSFRETRKEELLELWNRVIAKTNLEIQCKVRLEAIEVSSGAFTVETSAGRHTASRVLLAIGRRGTPRKLGVPGEELPKVVYRLTAPEQYRGQRVLVVGGGDSAIEAAVSLAAEPGTEVALSYRSEAFSRAKLKNRERVEAAAAKAELQLLLASRVSSIDASSVMIETPNGPKEIANDAVIVCAGGILPTPLLRTAGIEIVTRHGEA